MVWTFHLNTSAAGAGAGLAAFGTVGVTVTGACCFCSGTCGFILVGAPGVGAAGAQAASTKDITKTKIKQILINVDFVLIILDLQTLIL